MLLKKLKWSCLRGDSVDILTNILGDIYMSPKENFLSPSSDIFNYWVTMIFCKNDDVWNYYINYFTILFLMFNVVIYKYIYNLVW